MRVLLIEDDSATARSIELMLKGDGLNVYTTDQGEEGVDLGIELGRVLDVDEVAGFGRDGKPRRRHQPFQVKVHIEAGFVLVADHEQHGRRDGGQFGLEIVERRAHRLDVAESHRGACGRMFGQIGRASCRERV